MTRLSPRLSLQGEHLMCEHMSVFYHEALRSELLKHPGLSNRRSLLEAEMWKLSVPNNSIENSVLLFSVQC